MAIAEAPVGSPARIGPASVRPRHWEEGRGLADSAAAAGAVGGRAAVRRATAQNASTASLRGSLRHVATPLRRPAV